MMKMMLVYWKKVCWCKKTNKTKTKQSPWNYLPDFKRYLVVNSFLVQNCLFAHLLGHHQQSSWDHTVQWRPSHCNFGWRKMKIYQQLVQNVQKQTNKQKPLKPSGVQEPVLLTLCYKCYIFYYCYYFIKSRLKRSNQTSQAETLLVFPVVDVLRHLGVLPSEIWNVWGNYGKLRLFDYSDKYN